MPEKQKIAVIGAGILGLAHAYLAAKAGHAVTVFERNPQAVGASVRNFGMIWPIGQPAGVQYETALRSAEIWLSVLKDAGLPFRNNGSLHVAYREDEAAVMEEFSHVAPKLGYRCSYLSKDQISKLTSAVHLKGLLGGLYSKSEFTVDPRQVIQALPIFLQTHYGVEFKFNTAVHAIDLPRIETGQGRYVAEQVFLCGGDDFSTLYPQMFQTSGLIRCKLQMMRTVPQPSGWDLGPSLASGLTLRHYSTFEACKSLPDLKKRIAKETPEFDQYGIHALVSQTSKGELTLGDSHEYGLHLDPFDKELIDCLILDYTKKFLNVPDLRIAERWHGVYVKHPDNPALVMNPAQNVRVVASPGGSGMTLSFGLAERSLRETNLSPKVPSALKTVRI